MSVSVPDAKISDLATANKYIRTLKSEKLSLQFPNLELCSILTLLETFKKESNSELFSINCSTDNPCWVQYIQQKL